VRNENGPPNLIIDGGTGLQRITPLCAGGVFNGTVLLSHLHWDHTHGIPFSSATNNPAARVRVVMPEQGQAEEVLSRAISPPHFPVRPSQLTGDWSFAGIEQGSHEIEGLTVTAVDIPHPGGRMFGYRISDSSKTWAYISDHSPIDAGPGPQGFGEYHSAIKKLAAGVDLLLHDAQYTAEEFPGRRRYGHSTFDYAVGLARECGVPRLLLFHHDPARTDQQLDTILARWREKVGGEMLIEAAREGSELEV
jgi:ribonuclease BN (tRNA processing enzyme)